MTTQTMPERAGSSTAELTLTAPWGGRRVEPEPADWEDEGPIAAAQLPPCGTD